MPKILHVGMPLMPGIALAMSKLCDHYFLDWTAFMEYGDNGRKLLETELSRASAEIKQDITFLHIQRPGVITKDFIKSLPGKIINYTYDVAVPIPEWYFELAPFCTTVFCDENGVREFRNRRFRAVFALPAYDDKIFSPDGPSGNYAEIVFLGNHYKDSHQFPLTDMRHEMVGLLKRRYGKRFAVYGNGWGDLGDGNLMFKEDKEAECYRSCKIAINFSHFDLERYTSDRMFRIMGSGAFCLTKSYPLIDVDFVDGKHLRSWSSLDELCELIDYYLSHDDERDSIRSVGHKYVKSTGTWDVRINSIINGQLQDE